MQKFTQKYVIVALLKRIEKGTKYSASDWPLHVTIASPFTIDINKTNIIENISKLLITKKPFTVTAAGDEYFGFNKGKLVTILNINKELIALHNDIITLLKNAGAIFDDPEHIEKGFRAHVTVQPHARLKAGDIIEFSEITLIDMFPDNDPFRRKIIENFKLSN